jgi:hypothetical protein
MKKVSLWFLLAVFFISLLAQGAAKESPILGPNLIDNGDFELDSNEDGLPDNWYPFARGGPDVVLDPTTKESGSHSFLIHKISDEGNAAGIEQNTVVQGGAKYEFKITMKMERLQGYADYFKVLAVIFDGVPWKSTYLTEKVIFYPEPSDEFTEYTSTLTMPEGANYLVLDLMVATDDPLSYEAKIWIDSISMCKVYSKPLFPPIVKATRLENGQVQLNWQVEKNAEGDLPTRFEIYRSTNSKVSMNEETKVAENIEGTTWTDESLSIENEEKYYYLVKAYDEMNRFIISKVATVSGR